MNRCACYCRVSLEEQTDNFSLSSQERGLREYAASNRYQVVDVFTDDGYLGSDLDRPALEQIRALMRGKGIDVLIAYDPDRLSRKLSHMAILQDECERYGVRLEFVTTKSEDSAEGRMLMSLKGVFAEYEREKIRERTLRGRREKARQGFIVGGVVPYGYTYAGKSVGKRGELLIDEDQASVVRRMFEWAAAGESTRGIAARLNEQGVKPKTAARWGKSSVFKALRNQTYIGKAYYNRLQRAIPANAPESHKLRRDKKTVRRVRPSEEWIAVPVPAIITSELFEAVAQRLKRNAEVLSGQSKRVYLLRGLIRCAKCQHKFGGNPVHGVRYYRCIGRDKGGYDPPCKAREINAENIERAVWQAVVKCFRSPETLRGIVARHLQRFTPEQGPTVDPIRTLQRIEEYKKKEARAAKALLDADLAEHYSLFKREFSAAKDERRRLEAALQASSSGQRSYTIGDVNEYAQSICEQFLSALDAATDEAKRRFVEHLVKFILWDGETAKIHCCIGSDVGYRPQRSDGGSAGIR